MQTDSDNQRDTTDNRGVSPVIGYVFVLAFVAFVGGGLIIIGFNIIDDGSESPTITASFDFASGDNATDIGIQYTDGTNLTAQNTDRIVVLTENQTRIQQLSNRDVTESEYKENVSDIQTRTVVYNNTVGYTESVRQRPVPNTSPANLSVTPGDYIVGPTAQNISITAETTATIIWVPEGNTDRQIVLDTISVPQQVALNLGDVVQEFDGIVVVGGAQEGGNQSEPPPS